MTHIKPVDALQAQLVEVAGGQRGFISIPSFVRAWGGDPKVLRQTARALGFAVKAHGRYGYCIFRSATGIA